MKIIIFADTHMYFPPAIKALKDISDVDLIFHLGDYVDDAKKISMETGIPYKAVRGNKDWHADAPDLAFWEYEGVRIMALHGHLEDINRNDSNEDRLDKFRKLADKAKKENARIVLYGHDHLIQKFYVDDILFFNPGEMVYGAKNPSFGDLEIKDGGFSLEHVEVYPDDSFLNKF